MSMMRTRTAIRAVALAWGWLMCLSVMVDAGDQPKPGNALVIVYTNNTNGWLDPCG